MAAVLALAPACGGDDSSGTADVPEEPPFERTEVREPCDNYDPLRQPLFGDLHIHTGFSYDAAVARVTGTPQDTYRFARGEQIELPGTARDEMRTVRLDRSLDFAAVTDHAEFLGEVRLCTTSDSAAFDHPQCDALRGSGAFLSWGISLVRNPPTRLELCGNTGADCFDAARSPWGETQAAAEEAYDRSAACEFTSFIGYEHTPQRFSQDDPVGSFSIHRNVIFRNANVPDAPASYFDTAAGGAAHAEVGSQLWRALDTQCTEADFGCEALTIPHNPNQSGGLLFLDPADADDARQRRRYEPLVEMMQVKGASECRFDRLAGRGAFTTDELCGFEQLPAATTLGSQPISIDEFPRRALVRSVLIDGLALGRTLGVNPFQFGLIGGTDTHNATAGAVDEANWPGFGGFGDAASATRVAAMTNNPGGLTGVWAEENSRDAIFSALRRREAWATSGPRIAVRLFAGEELDSKSCNRADAVAHGYDVGVPMGAELGDASKARLLVIATADPGTASRPGTDLQAVQIIKGWVDGTGATHERVFDVAGDLENGASVNPESCEPVGDGHRALCAVFDDPDFDPDAPAFYYARVIENPTCRWSTYDCMAAGVNPFDPDCAATAPGGPFANCCRNESNHSFVTPTIRERAWTSPIWFVPPSR